MKECANRVKNGDHLILNKANVKEQSVGMQGHPTGNFEKKT